MSDNIVYSSFQCTVRELFRKLSKIMETWSFMRKQCKAALDFVVLLNCLHVNPLTSIIFRILLEFMKKRRKNR
jgi:hypothetical protein